MSSHIRRGGKWVKQSASLPSFLESNRREAPKRETVEEGESDMLPSLSLTQGWRTQGLHSSSTHRAFVVDCDYKKVSI